jgi:hypothetical protein
MPRDLPRVVSTPGARVVLALTTIAAAMTGSEVPAQVGPTADTCAAVTLVGLEAHGHRLGVLGVRAPAVVAGPTGATAEHAEAAGAWRDFAVVADAVLGTPPHTVSPATIVAAIAGTGRPTLTCRGGALARDRLAHRMVLGGYSATETADVVSGRLTLGEIDRAQALVMAGHADRAAALLDRAIARRAPTPGAPPTAEGGLGTRLARYRARIEHLARRHGVPAALVEAVVAVESAARADAVSPKGAIGLMQLMPPTAAALGVDPTDPDENLDGGTRYLAGLLALFRDETLALVAYNAGPTHARRVQRGESVVYDETRRYVAAIRTRLGR